MLLDNITKLVQQYADDAIIKNPAVPNEKNEIAIKETAASLMNQLAGKNSSIDKSALSKFFDKNDDIAQNPSVGKISDGIAGDLLKKLGINNAAATGIVNKMVPVILNKLKNKTNDPNDKDFDLQDILGSLGGQGNILNTIKNIFSGKK